MIIEVLVWRSRSTVCGLALWLGSEEMKLHLLLQFLKSILLLKLMVVKVNGNNDIISQGNGKKNNENMLKINI